MPSNTYGRQVVEALVNKSGGSVAAGDVVIIDTSNDGAFTTTTTARTEVTVGIAQETIASNATGRVLLSGYAALVNVPASVTRGHYVETHTVAKQAVGNSTRRSGSIGQFRTGGTTPTAVLWGNADQTPPAAAALSRTTVGTTSAGASFATTRGTYIKKVTLATDGLVASIHAFVKGTGSNQVGMMVGILSDSAGAPVSVIAANGPQDKESDSSALTGLGLSTTVRDLAMPIGRWLAAGDYWLAVGIIAGADSRMQLAYNSGSGTDRKFTHFSAVLYDQSVNSYGSSDTNDYCIYADILR